MNQEQNLLLETVRALIRWLDTRITQDSELKTTLTNLELGLKNFTINKCPVIETTGTESVINTDYSENIDISSKAPIKIFSQTITTTSDTTAIQFANEFNHNAQDYEQIVTQVSPEKLAELQLKWATIPHEVTATFHHGSLLSRDTFNLNNSPFAPKRVDHIRRCLALKAEAFCLKIDILEEPDAPTELAQGRLIASANALGTRLWVFDVASALCPYPEQLADISVLFSLCADSSLLLIGLLNDIDSDQENAFKDYLTECLNIIAEAQSMLKTALERVPFAYEDSDQKQLFSVVRDLTSQKQIYIPRYMKTRDQADPSLWRNLRLRMQDFIKRLEVRRSQRQAVQAQQQISKKIQGQISYHLRRIKNGLGDEHDWQRIADAIIYWSESGLKADDLRLRTMLEPIAAILPDILQTEPQKLVQAYLHSWDFADGDEELGDDDSEHYDEHIFEDPIIKRVADWLHGRTVVLIGGNEKPKAKDALIRAFALKDVIWIATKPHETIEILKTPIRRDEVGLVMLVIRWASHAYGNISAFCHRLEKPFVRLPAGYNPKRVAHEIVGQVSHHFIDG